MKFHYVEDGTQMSRTNLFNKVGRSHLMDLTYRIDTRRWRVFIFDALYICKSSPICVLIILQNSASIPIRSKVAGSNNASR